MDMVVWGASQIGIHSPIKIRFDECVELAWWKNLTNELLPKACALDMFVDTMVTGALWKAFRMSTRTKSNMM